MAGSTDGLDTVFELGIRSAEDLNHFIQSMDSKSLGMLGLATALIGVVVAKPGLEFDIGGPGAMFWAALTMAAFAVLINMWALFPRERAVSRDPKILITDYLEMDSKAAKLKLLEYAGDDFCASKRLATQKSLALYATTLVVMLEFAFLISWVLWDTSI